MPPCRATGAVTAGTVAPGSELEAAAGKGAGGEDSIE